MNHRDAHNINLRLLNLTGSTTIRSQISIETIYTEVTTKVINLEIK